MIIDLSDYNVSYVIYHDQDTLPDNVTERNIPYLTKEKWLVVLAVEIPEANMESLSNSYFQSEDMTRIKLYSDKDICIIPLTSLVGP